MKNEKRMRLIYGFMVMVWVFSSCGDGHLYREARRDWKEIQQQKKLTLLTENSSLSYFEYRGKRLGFEYEILDTFCKANGLKLDVKVVANAKDFVKYLRRGEGDVVAANMAVSLKDGQFYNYSEPYYYTHQVLVQRKEDSLIKEPAELAGRRVVVRQNSAFSKRLHSLQEEIGARIHIISQQGSPITEDLIEEVANGVIPYTVAHENLARISQEMHPNLDIRTRMSFQQKIAFALRKHSPELKTKLDSFIVQYAKSSAYTELKKKYFDYIDATPIEIYITKKGHLSPFDELFKAAAKSAGWDWKILAAISFKESRFNPNARGFGGAYGLMQFMPNTGPRFGVFPGSTPEVQIKGGMRLLVSTYRRWAQIADPTERLKFTLASYNAGPCHIEDAQNLAKAAGFDPYKWDGNVELMVKKLSEPKYYRSEHVHCGAYRGHATAYVRTVMSIYEGWK